MRVRGEGLKVGFSFFRAGSFVLYFFFCGLARFVSWSSWSYHFLDMRCLCHLSVLLYLTIPQHTIPYTRTRTHGHLRSPFPAFILRFFGWPVVSAYSPSLVYRTLTSLPTSAFL